MFHNRLFLMFFRMEHKVFRVENEHASISPFICTKYFNSYMLDTTTIIAVALSTVVLLIIIGLVAALVYYHWRNSELMSGLSYFIRQNRKLEDEVDALLCELRKQRKAGQVNYVG